MANDSTAETVSMATTSMYITVEAELDFEVEKAYLLLLTVTDTQLSLTGYIAVRVRSSELVVLHTSV